MKKKKKRIYHKFFLLLIIIIASLVIYQKFFKEEKIKVVSEIDDYSYYLESNETKIYKKYYNELKKELSSNRIDEENYAKLISKLFLIDFYTLSNKITNQDVGGLQFIHDDIRDNFQIKATDTLYKYVKSNIYGNRNQELPTVKDVEIESIDKFSYSYHDKTDEEAYKVKAKITYKKDLGYDSKITLVIIHDDIKLQIVEIN